MSVQQRAETIEYLMTLQGADVLRLIDDVDHVELVVDQDGNRTLITLTDQPR